VRSAPRASVQRFQAAVSYLPPAEKRVGKTSKSAGPTLADARSVLRTPGCIPITVQAHQAREPRSWRSWVQTFFSQTACGQIGKGRFRADCAARHTTLTICCCASTRTGKKTVSVPRRVRPSAVRCVFAYSRPGGRVAREDQAFTSETAKPRKRDQEGRRRQDPHQRSVAVKRERKLNSKRSERTHEWARAHANASDFSPKKIAAL